MDFALALIKLRVYNFLSILALERGYSLSHRNMDHHPGGAQMEQRLRDSSRNPSVDQASWRKDSRRQDQQALDSAPETECFCLHLSQRITVTLDAQGPSGDACWLSFCEQSFSPSSVLGNRLGYWLALFWVLAIICAWSSTPPPLFFSQILKLYSLGIFHILGQINYS